MAKGADNEMWNLSSPASPSLNDEGMWVLLNACFREELYAVATKSCFWVSQGPLAWPLWENRIVGYIDPLSSELVAFLLVGL